MALGDPFFTSDELALQLQLDVGTINYDVGDLLAALASDVVRDDLRQQIDPVVNDTITLYGDGGELIVLPERPVTAVTSVLLAGLPVPLFNWHPNGALRRVIYAGTQFASQQIMVWPFGVQVQVTYSHGYTVVPNVIKAMAIQLAAAAYANPELLVSKSVDDVMYRFEKSSGLGGLPAMMLDDAQRRQMDRYRAMDI